MDTLRALLVQRAARLQGRPALTAADWGTLSWTAWRNRVEQVGFALMATADPALPLQARTGTPWDWACEVAAASCGLRWDPAALAVAPEFFAKLDALAEDGRGPYHHREKAVGPETPFTAGLDQGTLLLRLKRLNSILEWDHRTVLRIPASGLGSPGARAALWSLLYAGGHAVLDAKGGEGWDAPAFEGFWRP